MSVLSFDNVSGQWLCDNIQFSDFFFLHGSVFCLDGICVRMIILKMYHFDHHHLWNLPFLTDSVNDNILP